MFPSLMSLTVAVPSPLLETSSTELSRGPRTKITAETATMATTSTTVMARNRLRFLVKSIGVSSSFSKRKSIKQPKLGGFFKKQKVSLPHYTRNLSKRQLGTGVSWHFHPCGNLGPLLQ